MSERIIYILLTDTGTYFSQMIKLYTKHELNHASIAFDSELTEVYSFGRTQRYNPLSGGFIREQVEGDLIRSQRRPTLCALYSCTVSDVQYKRMRNRIRYIEMNRDQYRYNLAGIFAFVLRIKIERRNAYFCSQFVASLFEENGVHLIDKDAEWVMPNDFNYCSQLQLVYKGDLRHLRQAVRSGIPNRGIAASL